jgi:hypothetical protein
MAVEIVQDESGNYGIAGYMTPDSGAEEFSKKELRDLYLLHSDVQLNKRPRRE